MRKSSLAYFRQLCCLGVGGQAVMPDLLGAMHDLIASETNLFLWTDATGRLSGFMPEYFIPEVLGSFLGESEKIVDRVVPTDFVTVTRRGGPTGNLLPLFDSRFYRGPLYNLVCRPYKLDHVLVAVVCDTPERLGIGAFVVGRSPRQREFSQPERVALQRLLPYLARAMHYRSDVQPGGLTDCGESGLLLLDPLGKIAYLSSRARQILHLASGGGLRGTGDADSTILRRIYATLVTMFQKGDAQPAVIEPFNAAGRFVFRAHWLEATKSTSPGVVAVTVQQQEPLALVMMRNMHRAGLSQRQRDIGMLLSQNLAFDTIATRLKISHATAKDYAQRLYCKLQVHSREEMLQKLR